jgi:hypothetical protein
MGRAIIPHRETTSAVREGPMRTIVALLGIAALGMLFGCGGGSSGVSDVEIVSGFYQGDPTADDKLVEVPCPSGKKALGGGFEVAAVVPIDVRFSESMGQLGQAPTGWQAFAEETTQIDPAEEWSFSVSAICATLNP